MREMQYLWGSESGEDNPGSVKNDNRKNMTLSNSNVQLQLKQLISHQ